MKVVLADSVDGGQTWTAWRTVRAPPDLGPPSLTSPLLKLPGGRLALSIESNKNYDDARPWVQFVTWLISSDGGTSWDERKRVCGDPSGRYFHWDQRAVVAPNGRAYAFTWMYDSVAEKYLDIVRFVSCDSGSTWTTGESLGIRDQPSHPAILPDGRTVLAGVALSCGSPIAFDEAGERVAVVGLGVIGLATCGIARLMGADVTAVANSTVRAEAALRVGAHRAVVVGRDELPADMPVVILMANPWAAYLDSVRMAGMRGRISILGFPGRAEPLAGFNPLARNGSTANNSRSLAQATLHARSAPRVSCASICAAISNSFSRLWPPAH